eukprot:1235252-Rhodomonas_salina.1
MERVMEARGPRYMHRGSSPFISAPAHPHPPTPTPLSPPSHRTRGPGSGGRRTRTLLRRHLVAAYATSVPGTG